MFRFRTQKKVIPGNYKDLLVKHTAMTTKFAISYFKAPDVHILCVIASWKFGSEKAADTIFKILIEEIGERCVVEEASSYCGRRD